jgi:hypothetical protein
VLQPPQIRHRVLESSPGLEVIEIGCPADHETLADLELQLPTPALRPERDFGGQRFVRHEAAAAAWHPGRVDGFESRDLGIATATNGVATAQVSRWRGPARPLLRSHDAEFLFSFVLRGAAHTAWAQATLSCCRPACATRSRIVRTSWSCWRWRCPPDSAHIGTRPPGSERGPLGAHATL